MPRTQGVIRRLMLAVLACLISLVTAHSVRAQDPIDECREIGSGNWVVTRNLVAPAGEDCLVITDSNVTIDLGGHTIRGDDSENTVGITADGAALTGIIIHNGRIRDFAVGIDLGYSTRVTLDRLTVTSNLSDGIRTGGMAVITNTAATDNGGDGINIVCAEICSTFESLGSTLRNITVSRNGGDGIDGQDCCTIVTRADVQDNTGNGIILKLCCNFVTHAQVRRNGGDGIELTGCCNVVMHAQVRRNGGDGIELTGCCNLVADSVGDRNAGDGIEVTDNFNAVLDTTARDNTGHGILLTGQQNTVVDSRALRNGGDGVGVLVEENVFRKRNRLVSVVANRNLNDGIRLEGEDHLVSNTTTKSNQKDGLEIGCPSNVLRLTSTGNARDLVTVTPGLSDDCILLKTPPPVDVLPPPVEVEP